MLIKTVAIRRLREVGVNSPGQAVGKEIRIGRRGDNHGHG